MGAGGRALEAGIGRMLPNAGRLARYAGKIPGRAGVGAAVAAEQGGSPEWGAATGVIPNIGFGRPGRLARMVGPAGKTGTISAEEARNAIARDISEESQFLGDLANSPRLKRIQQLTALIPGSQAATPYQEVYRQMMEGADQLGQISQLKRHKR